MLSIAYSWTPDYRNSIFNENLFRRVVHKLRLNVLISLSYARLLRLVRVIFVVVRHVGGPCNFRVSTWGSFRTQIFTFINPSCSLLNQSRKRLVSNNTIQMITVCMGRRIYSFTHRIHWSFIQNWCSLDEFSWSQWWRNVTQISMMGSPDDLRMVCDMHLVWMEYSATDQTW